MYAIISTDGHQVKVEEGQEYELDFRDGLNPGDEVTFDSVLAISGEGEATLGEPVVDGASVTAEVLGTTFGKKLVIQKFRRRKNSRRKTGHRQMYTKVKVTKISS